MTKRRPPRRDQRRTTGASEEREVEIAKLGSEGLGVAYLDDKPVLVAGALPGERVVAAVTAANREARLVRVVEPSAARATPACRHFGRCGGCAVQHLERDAYLDFKRNLILDALRRHGLGDVELAATAVSPPGSRRRTSLEALRLGSSVTLGYHGRAAHTLVDIVDCPVLEPALLDLLGPTRRLLLQFLKSGERASIVLAQLDHGIDIGLVLPREPDLEGFEALSAFAEAQDVCRLWWRVGAAPAIPAAIRRTPTIRLGGLPVTMPMGGFLQATRSGEATLVAEVLRALAGTTAIADLFSGAGTFALPAAVAGKLVHAVEADAEAIAALAVAGNAARLTGLTTERRDLEARPLREAELKRYDAVVFDPPRAGARAQVDLLARASLERIVAVSCNPSTYARDAAALIAGGWRHERITPVDQFLWSPHIELVGVFSRGS